MTKIRTVLSVLVIALLGLGYAGSQFAALQGTAPDYTAKIDSAPVKWLALLTLIISIALAFVSKGEANDK